MADLQNNIILSELREQLQHLESKLPSDDFPGESIEKIKKIYKDYSQYIYNRLKKARAYSYSESFKEKFIPLSRSMNIAENLLRKIHYLTSARSTSLHWRYAPKGDPVAFVHLGDDDLIRSFESAWLKGGAYENRLIPYLDQNEVLHKKLTVIKKNPAFGISSPLCIYRFQLNKADNGILLIVLDNNKFHDLSWESLKGDLLRACKVIPVYISYLNKNESIETIFKDSFARVDRKVMDIINANTSVGRNVSISLFQFHSFDRYFSNMGENFSREFMDEISDYFLENLNVGDSLFILSPEEYLVVSPDCSMEQMQSKFLKSSFTVKGLVINFFSNFVCISQPVSRSEEVWGKVYYRPQQGSENRDQDRKWE